MKGLPIALALAGCAVPSGSTTTTQQADTVCAGGPTIQGVDVSSYDTSVDFAAAHAGGIEFAFVRASDGTQYPDPMFATHWANARAAGVIVGAYQFFRPAEDPIAQADLLLQRAQYQPGDLPPVLDLENAGGLTQAQVVTAVTAWVDHITAAIGRPPIVYAGLYSWPTLTNSADFTTSPLWIAQYTSAACPDIPLPWTKWLFWQYGASGTVPGITGAMTDVDVFNGTLADLVGFANGTPPATCGQLDPSGGMIDDGDPCFATGGPPTYLRHVTGAGMGGSLIWTHATASATEANFAQWNLDFAEAGHYLVEAYTDTSYAQSHEAAYTVHAQGGDTVATIDQSAVNGWQTLGEFDFAAGADQWIHLGDNTGEPTSANLQLVFDAIRVTRLDDTTPPPPAHHEGGGCSTTSDSSSLLALLSLAALTCRRRSRARRAPASPRSR